MQCGYEYCEVCNGTFGYLRYRISPIFFRVLLDIYSVSSNILKKIIDKRDMYIQEIPAEGE